MHDSFHQLIQEQSQWAAQEGLELQQREQEATGKPRPGCWAVWTNTWVPQPLRMGLPALQAWDGVGDTVANSISRTPASLSVFVGSGQQTLRRPEGTQSTATLRILASMPSRTIGEWGPRPELIPAPGAGLGFPPGISLGSGCSRSSEPGPGRAPSPPHLSIGGPAQPHVALFGF